MAIPSLMYDYLVVGCGLFGSVFAQRMTAHGFRVLVVDKRNHIGGNVYTEEVEGIQVHRYGAHIFHTNDRNVWDYVNRFAEFNRYTNCPIARYKEHLYSLPFNMHTFYEMWGVRTPHEAKSIIEQQKKQAGITIPRNLEEQAISLVGQDIYEKLIQGYTEKQWGKPCSELPPFIIRRLPVRFTFDNNYFNARYQGVPIGGYTRLVERILEGLEVRLNTDFLQEREQLSSLAHKILFTGPIDAYYDYCFGPLEYRSVRFETELLPIPNFQGNAVVNYTERDIPWTRIIEHKWFEGIECPHTVISREFSASWKRGDEPYYPVNDAKNNALYSQYRALAEREKRVLFGGRLGLYRYYDMDAVIAAAFELAEKETER